ncbi:dienelactone hydrolase family protein [Modestobacter muralis]|nr:dienelactone hydrolase family protein [Modestobacter muralis]
MPDTTIDGAASAPQLRADLAVPPVGTGPWPCVVVVHEAFGLTNDTRQQADRLAAGGYLALAPDLFTAGGPVRCLRSTFRALARQEGAAFDYLDVAAPGSWRNRTAPAAWGSSASAWAAASPWSRRPAASTPRPPTTGRSRKISKACCRAPARWWPATEAATGRCPGAAQRLDGALTGLGVDHDVKEYPDAGHSFMNRHNDGPLAVLERVGGFGCHDPSAEDAWRRIFGFFGRHLQGEKPTAD